MSVSGLEGDAFCSADNATLSAGGAVRRLMVRFARRKIRAAKAHTPIATPAQIPAPALVLMALPPEGRGVGVDDDEGNVDDVWGAV